MIPFYRQRKVLSQKYRARLETQVWAVQPCLPGNLCSQAMPTPHSFLCPCLANFQQAHKNQKPENIQSGKMPGILGLCLTFVHLMMLEFRAGFLNGWGGQILLLLLPPTSVGAAHF